MVVNLELEWALPEALPLSWNVTESCQVYPLLACSVALVTLFYLSGQWLIIKEVKTEQLTQNLLICPLHLPTPSTPLVTNPPDIFYKSLETLICFDRMRQPVIITSPGSTRLSPTVCENLLQKKKRKENPSPKRAVCPQEVIHGLGSCKPDGAGGGRLGTGSGKRQPRRGYSDLNGFCWKKVKNRMTKSPVKRIVCLVKWANTEVHWQIRQEK